MQANSHKKISSFPLGKLLYFQSLLWYDLNSEGEEVEKLREHLKLADRGVIEPWWIDKYFWLSILSTTVMQNWPPYNASKEMIPKCQTL